MKKIIVLAIAICFLASPSVVHARVYPAIKCWKHYDVMDMISEDREMMRQVDYIMWRESRCNALVINRDDPMGGSIGLFQINQFWCKPNSQTKRGFLQDAGVLRECYELYNPIVNGRAMMAIYDYAHNRYGDGWGPWGGSLWN